MREASSAGSLRRRRAAAIGSHGKAVERLARFGFAAKGVVYVVIGWLAAQAAFGAGGQTTGSTGAFQEILSEPYGQILLGIVAVGLVGYAVWRLVQCFLDPDREGGDAKGKAKRAGYFVSALVHAGLAVHAVRMILGHSGGSRGGGAEGWTAQLMAQPYGQWLVAIVGFLLIGVGIFQFQRGREESFMRRLRLSGIGASARRWIVRAGKIGYISRGVVFAIIGGFLIIAAYRANPQEAKGLGEALRTLAQQPYGPYLLFVVGVGLLAYGLFQFVLARYRALRTG